MAQGLLASGVHLQLLTINTKKHFKPDSGVPAAFSENAHYRSVYKNTNVTLAGAFLNLFSRRSYFVSRFFFPRFRKTLVETLKREKFDVIQLEGLFMGTYVNTIRKYSAAKIVLRAHNIEHFIWKRHIRQERFYFRRAYLGVQNARLRRFEEWVFQKVDAIVPISTNDEKAIRAMGFSTPIHTCMMGVNIAEYSAPADVQPRPKSVFYFGSMDWLPNREAVNWFLKNCWDKIHAEVPQAKLIVAGRGMPLSFYHLTAPNISIIEKVESAKAFFHQHDIMIVPLWSGSGLRIKIVEGMAYGKAIVSTSIGAEGTGATHGKNILIADSPADFIASVTALLKNDVTRKNIGAAAAAYASERFDNRRLVNDLVGFYEKLLNG